MENKISCDFLDPIKKGFSNMDWYSFCMQLTDAIWNVTKPLIGTDDAAQKIKKGNKNSKKIDILAEDTVIQYIKQENLDVNLLSEEIGEIQIGMTPKYTIILDPIDGTTNAIKGLPFFSTSIAIAKGNLIKDIFFGYIRNYLTNEIFYVNQNGAFYNDRQCISSSCTNISRALISLYSYSIVNYQQMRKILNTVRKMRLFGAISIEISYVGCNKLDGIIDLRGDLLITDIAAGILFLNKAGGVISDANGNEISGELDRDKGYSVIAAGNQVMHENFLKVIRS